MIVNVQLYICDMLIAGLLSLSKICICLYIYPWYLYILVYV